MRPGASPSRRSRGDVAQAKARTQPLRETSSLSSRSSGRDPLTGDIPERAGIRARLGSLPQLVLGVDDDFAVLGAPVPRFILEAAQENDLPAMQDDFRECHSHLLVPAWEVRSELL